MTLIFGSLSLGSKYLNSEVFAWVGICYASCSAGFFIFSAQKVDENINGPWDACRCERERNGLGGTILTSASKSSQSNAQVMCCKLIGTRLTVGRVKP